MGDDKKKSEPNLQNIPVPETELGSAIKRAIVGEVTVLNRTLGHRADRPERSRGMAADRPTLTLEEVSARATDRAGRFTKLTNELRYYKWSRRDIARAIAEAEQQAERGETTDMLDGLARYVDLASAGEKPPWRKGEDDDG